MTLKTYLKEFPPVVLGLSRRVFGDITVSRGFGNALAIRQDGHSILIDAQTASELAALINSKLDLVSDGVQEE